MARRPFILLSLERPFPHLSNNPKITYLRLHIVHQSPRHCTPPRHPCLQIVSLIFQALSPISHLFSSFYLRHFHTPNHIITISSHLASPSPHLCPVTTNYHMPS